MAAPKQSKRFSRNRRLAVRAKERDWYRCVQCGHVGRSSRDVEADHIIPLEEGGPDSLENIQTLCVPCHLKKHGKEPPPPDLAAWDRRLRELAEGADSVA